MKHFYWLDRLEIADRALVGEKAWHLSQLQQQGYPVLPGYAIPAQPLQDWLEQHPDFLRSDLSAAGLEFNDYRSLQRVAQDYRQALLAATLPAAALDAWMDAAESWRAPALMIRASLSLPADVALDVTGLLPAEVCWPCPAALATALKRVWGNLFCARNLLFWQKAGLDPSQLRLALLVQPCQEAIASGRMLWRNGKVWLQAVPGLGHSLVRGEVLPDCYQFDPVTGNLEARQVGNQSLAYHLRTDMGGHCLEVHWLPETPLEPILEDNWLEALLSLCQRLGKSPLKRLEWTLSMLPTPGKLYLTQAIFQPLETRTVDSAAAPTNPANPLLRGLGASPGIARAPAHILSGAAQHLQTIPAGCILVARHLTPDWLPLMKRSAGVIAERGGLTSHAAIIARELNIPAVVGAANATKLLATGDPLLLSGDRGEVYRLVEGEALPAFAPESQRLRLPLSPPPLATQLLVNLSQPNSIARAAQLPVDGVGLLRSELMLSELLSSGTLADWLEGQRREVLRERLVSLVSQFAAAFAPRPVFYRSTDWRAGEFAQLFPESSPSHLGRGRGTYRYLEDPAWFELELGALAQVLAAGFQNVHLLLPFVRSLEEFCFVRDRVQQLPVRRQGLLQLWIVAEVPSVLYLLPDYVKAGVQGIAIGSNDLMQLLLGVDRDGDFRETPLNVTHPAFLAALKQLIEQAQQLGIPCSFCGQAVVQDPSLIDRLVSWGISALSVEPDAVESTYWAVARAEQRLLLAAARRSLEGKPIL